ncbi:hypothetical protein GCM10011414_15100 [Croceivirga lutea]|uniref:LytR/AlgR family response regulator transcription factor n=1 Tax=Croceivirga lutea TaxID=1775167 RepID=UPI00163AAB59|nr:response regulator [Croceivirga lutea]GGG46437.1 hypothetical protein GCM10011414_15100 [Croceivirga lutea]
MDKVSILVVEDEILIAESICKNLTALGYEVFEPVLNYTDALAAIKLKKPDIAILDIQLSGQKSGIDLGKKIQDDYDFPFLFLSSNVDSLTVDEAKKVNPQAYLVKPFTKNELYTAVELALYNYAKITGSVEDENLLINDALFLKSDGVFSKIGFDDIIYVKSAHVYIEIFLKDGSKKLVRCSLNDIIEKLGNYFVRVHRGFIVNSRSITGIKNDSLMLDEIEIPIGKSFKEKLFEKVLLI